MDINFTAETFPISGFSYKVQDFSDIIPELVDQFGLDTSLTFSCVTDKSCSRAPFLHFDNDLNLISLTLFYYCFGVIEDTEVLAIIVQPVLNIAVDIDQEGWVIAKIDSTTLLVDPIVEGYDIDDSQQQNLEELIQNFLDHTVGEQIPGTDLIKFPKKNSRIVMLDNVTNCNAG